MSLEQRFWQKVEKREPSDCWHWLGTVLSSGYGQISDGRTKRWLAHRLAYVIAFGDIPEGMTIDHVRARGCQGGTCVNPAHLEAVTMTENLRRSNAWSAVNSRKTTCPEGHPFDRLRTRADGRKYRECSLCFNENQRRRRAARKEAA